MSDSLTLLALPHAEANRHIVEQVLRPDIDNNYLEIGEYLVREDGRVDLPLFNSALAYQDPEWIYRGEARVTYNRLDLQEAFGHLNLGFRVGANYTTDELVTRLGTILQIHFDHSEFRRETKTLTTPWDRYVLQAAADSPRWKGEVSIWVFR